MERFGAKLQTRFDVYERLFRRSGGHVQAFFADLPRRGREIANRAADRHPVHLGVVPHDRDAGHDEAPAVGMQKRRVVDVAYRRETVDDAFRKSAETLRGFVLGSCGIRHEVEEVAEREQVVLFLPQQQMRRRFFAEFVETLGVVEGHGQSQQAVAQDTVVVLDQIFT